MYVYIKTEANLYTVGFYSPGGEWHPDSDYNSREEATARVAWLNGSPYLEKEECKDEDG